MMNWKSDYYISRSDIVMGEWTWWILHSQVRYFYGWVNICSLIIFTFPGQILWVSEHDEYYIITFPGQILLWVSEHMFINSFYTFPGILIITFLGQILLWMSEHDEYELLHSQVRYCYGWVNMMSIRLLHFQVRYCYRWVNMMNIRLLHSQHILFTVI